MTQLLKKHIQQLVLSILLISLSFGANGQKIVDEDRFHYSFYVDFNEYSVLTGALVSGLTNYQGDIDYSVKMSNIENEIFWFFTINRKLDMEVLLYFVEEKYAEWSHTVEENPENESQNSAMNILYAIRDKVNRAYANPIWEIEKVVGTVVKHDNTWKLKSKDGDYLIKGALAKELGAMKGKTIVSHGYISSPMEIDLIRYIEKNENSLDLFVMSLCPYAQNAESTLLKYVDSLPVQERPSLNIHYIFYLDNGPEGFRYTALHGEEEIIENCVQILLRDNYPKLFLPYLKKRLNGALNPWEEVLESVNGDLKSIQTIKQLLVEGREQLIEKEHAYVATKHGIHDGSPTFVWEGELVDDLVSFDVFKDLKFSVPMDEGCSN